MAALSKVPGIGWVQISFFAGIVEGTFGFDDYKTGVPGESGLKVLTSDDPAEATAGDDLAPPDDMRRRTALRSAREANEDGE